MTLLQPSPFQLPGAESFELDGDWERWHISVWRPPGVEGAMPALYVTDPIATFLPTIGAIVGIQTFTHQRLQHTAVVGIAPADGPEGFDFANNHAKRLRDFTPTPHVRAPFAAGAALGAGHADQLLNDLLVHIAPHVEEHYGFNAEGRGIAGASLGGLLASYALLSRSLDFDRFLIISPSLWWDDEVMVARASQLPAHSLSGKQVYIATGAQESTAIGMWPPAPAEMLDELDALCRELDMCAVAERFALTLGGSGACIKQELIAKEHHVTVGFAALSRGLVELYDQ